jgi:LPXTG-motif cell wall-anchored protein
VRSLLVAGLAALAIASGATSASASPVPVLAYYYQWFNASSWNRAKIDYPLLGRYSSDEGSVMRRQVAWAQQVGIDGFIVSWKGTPTLDRRLRRMVGVAQRARFHLALIYEGLDFHRDPLPLAQVRADLLQFARRYGHAAPFRLFGPRPVVVWSGTWRYTRTQVASVTRAVRGSLLVLASERNAAAYARLADVVDGDAYYWSSADPFHTPGYARKLRSMGRAVHRRHGLWIAPATAGFDARLIGGTRVVSRRGGATLRRSLDVAATTAPDAVGVISWNEFSENSHIEPSRAYGFQELRTLAQVQGARPPVTADLDSSAAPATGAQYGVPVLAGFAVTLAAGGLLVARRRRGTPRGHPHRGATPPR